MKSNIKNVGLSFLTAILLVLGGCQVEVVEITDPIDSSAISADSAIAKLIEQITLKDGSIDNILDESSCATIAFPVTVIANEQEVVIEDEDDYVLVERIFDESETDVDVLEIVYPITVILADHTEVIVNSDQEFEELVKDCIEGGLDDDIECVDFVYPVDISIYDGTNQVTDVITINSDEEMHDLFESLEHEELISFVFPLTLVLFDGTVIEVNSNEDLEKLFEEVGDDCDEDDDNDHDDDDIDVDDTEIVDILVDGDWVITHFVDHDDMDETAAFNEYVFTFFEDGTATAIQGDLLVEGAYEIYGDDGSLDIALDFGTESPFDELNEDWDIHEFDHRKIELKDDSDDHEEKLVFERPENNGGGDEPDPEHTVTEFITDGEWLVANYNDSGDDDTALYHGYKFTFAEDGTVVATNDTDTVNGTWEEVIDTETHKLVLNMDDMIPFDELSDDWDVISLTKMRIELNDVNSTDDTKDILVFEKL